MNVKRLLMEFMDFVDENEEDYGGDTEGLINDSLDDMVVDWEEAEVETLSCFLED